MKIVDLNILLYAINERAAHHERVLKWWNSALRGEETIGLSWQVLSGFLRISTNPRVFPRPLDTDAALAAVDWWLTEGGARIVLESEGHWEILRALIREAGTAGNLVADAHLAALAIGHGAVLISCDTDFARFRGLRWENPLG